MAARSDRRPLAERRRMLQTHARRAALACACALPLFASGDLVVPTGGQLSLNGGSVVLGCTNLSSSGTTNVGTGSLLDVGIATIQTGGVVNGGSGTIEINQGWSNNGTFVAGTSTVDFGEDCSTGPATISGDTTFSTVSFGTTTGRDYVFAAGSTQTITSLLQISGTTSNPIQFHSSSPSQAAFINLLPAGSQQIQNVGVTDVWATNQPLDPRGVNQGGGGNALGWFGAVLTAGANAIPTLSEAALVALAALFALVVAWRERRAFSASAGRAGIVPRASDA
jgi:hypothetical protein